MAGLNQLALPLGALLLLLATTAIGAHSNNAKDLLTGHSTPMHSSLAHQFFALAAEHIANTNSNSTGNYLMTKDSYDNRDDEQDRQCDRDVERIRDAIDNMEEWALECKRQLYFILLLNPIQKIVELFLLPIVNQILNQI